MTAADVLVESLMDWGRVDRADLAGSPCRTVPGGLGSALTGPANLKNGADERT